jgi:predicted DNA-binding transcriptional regulator AlpA
MRAETAAAYATSRLLIYSESPARHREPIEMKKETIQLDHSLPKRGLSRAEAAYYIGVGTSKFDEMVKDARMPAPKRIDGRVVWDRRQIDEAFELLSDGNEHGNPWDRMTN